MSKKYRFILFLLSFIILITIGINIKGNLIFLLQEFWFSSGLLLLILLSLIDQPHFSKDSNIIVNAITASISLLLVPQANRDFIFCLFVGFVLYLLLTSYCLVWIRNNPLNEEKTIVQFLSRVNRQIGKPETIFSAFFLWGAVKQYSISSNEFNMLLLYWIIFTIFNIPELANTIEKLFSKGDVKLGKYLIGTIFGVQSKNTFLIKLLPNKPTIRLFDFVEFKYSVDNKIRKGLVFDVYLLNQEQWVKIISNKEIDTIFNRTIILSNHRSDAVYRLEEIPENDYLKRFIGIVTDNSSISRIRFIYNSKIEVSEGQLIETIIQGKKVLYQIVEGITRIEQLENKNQTGLIVGEAIQLGTWNNLKFHFEQFGWVPEINSPVYLASNINEYVIDDNEFLIGNIPNTNYPVIINKNTAITHHMAIIGVTGTGKSIFARNLIREFLKDINTKVICIDFTGEYINKFTDLSPTLTIDDTISEELFKDIDYIEKEIGDNYNKDTDNSRERKEKVSKAIYDELKKFLQNDSKLSIFELPHVENTSGVLTYTKTFFRILFHIAKKENCFGKRICLVLEEAHTIVPEWNFSGVSDKISQPLLNSIAQIALQGRKYNIGLLVIAQRTANVSKTILTQCNTIVSFQEFDKTSSEFLSNYFGADIVESLPKLKFRQAIAAGKAFKSSIPMIFEVPEIIEDATAEIFIN